MKRLAPLAVCAVLLWGCDAASLPDPGLSYHFDSPASVWEETFPLGNGRIGLMPDGGTESETFVLNEISTWSGSKENADNPEAGKYLDKIRSLIFEGRNDEAQELMYSTFTCGGAGSSRGSGYRKPYGAYQLFANMVIDRPEGGQVTDYRRELSLDRAEATVSYVRDGVRYTETAFASYSDDVAVVRLAADRKGALEFTLSLNRESNVNEPERWKPVCTADGNTITYVGNLSSGVESDDAASLLGMKIAGAARIMLPKGGTLTAADGKLKVDGASEAVVLVSMKTSYFGEEPEAASMALLEAASKKSFKALESSHLKSFGALFGRVDVDFGHDAEREALPMNERLVAFEKDHDDPSLASLYYQFGRYLLISSTRPGCLPPNLQGIWANTIKTPWNGDYHLNINLQMNLWPAEKGNLSELQTPLIEWTKRQVESGRHTAEVFYGARGWVSHSIDNVWEFTSPGEGPSWGATNTSAAWLCEHLYNHYLYTMDRDYLADVYPTMRDAALFFTDMLVEDPNNGYLVTAPTTSPENAFILPNGKSASICAGSTMDNQIIRELFSNVISASEILGTDEAFADTLRTMSSRIRPTQIGPDGRIMEWSQPYSEVDPHHRHVSHLYGLYPASEISVTSTPELAEAARKTLEARGDLSTGWSMAWKINFWARLHDGEHAFKLLTDLLHPASSTGTAISTNGGGSYNNLFCAHPPFQIDGNFGGSAGISEMLLQSQAGCIELLPALPKAWKDGSFSGLCVEGGAEISASWKDSKVTSIELKAKTEGDFLIKDFMTEPVHLKAGQTWKL